MAPFSFITGNRPMSNTDTTDATILEWHGRGVGPSGIANVLEAMGLGRWTAKAVRAALERLDDKAGIIRDAEAVFAPEGEGDDYGDVEGWEGHSGKFTRPWLDRTGRDVRDTGCPGDQGDLRDGSVDRSFADRALEHLERRERDDEETPFE